MNCIFICIFHQQNYDMFYLLLKSLIMYGNLNTSIILYTSTHFMNIIKQHYLYNSHILFEINDYNTVNLACKSKFDCFQLQSIQKYEKILYLDTDILIQNDINPLFDLCTDEILYVLEEGFITDRSNEHGLSLFGNTVDNYSDKTAFTSGIILFKNCRQIQTLFEKIKETFETMPYIGPCNDQPYIIYNAFKYNLYNNKILNNYIANYKLWLDPLKDYTYDLKSNKIIHHFPFHAGTFKEKLTNMNKCFTQFNLNSQIYDTKCPPFKNTIFPLVGICVSYNYYDTLKFMLPVNYLHFDTLYIITQEDDIQTIELCSQYKNVIVLFFKFKHDDKKFDKYGALNYAQQFIYNTYPNSWYLIIDSDILLPNNFIHILKCENLNPYCIYGATRNNAVITSELLNKKHIVQTHKNWMYNNIRWVKDKPPSIMGCFQLYKKHCYHRTTFTDASVGDYVFGYDNFKLFCNLTSLSYFHLGEGAKNWKGKISPFIDDIQIDISLLYYNFINTTPTIYYDYNQNIVLSIKPIVKVSKSRFKIKYN